MEIETQIIVGERLGYLDKEKSAQLLERTSEVARFLTVCCARWPQGCECTLRADSLIPGL